MRAVGNQPGALELTRSLVESSLFRILIPLENKWSVFVSNMLYSKTPVG